ncbi:T7SS effector LXG polymorphic toxin [Staphylococcus pettenkoferi]|uniref:T7SS effector LXG polymorphic toxin n=2 Tax=Staphylococcus pettenkoferi TaxID=170573 RepID=UPI00227465E1|nr:LXG domain-containing protein [Staphylococcus pettenkoferi]
MPRLVNSELEEYLNKTNDIKTKLNEALYNHYTECYFLSKTGSIKGEAADSIRIYVEAAHISTISRAINVLDEFESSVKHLKELGEECDKSSNAKIGTQTLEEIKKGVDTKKKEFIDITSNSPSILSEASEFIDTVSLEKDNVENDYNESLKKIDKTKEKLNNMDQKGKQSLESLRNELKGLITQINKLSSEYHDKNGIIESKINSITKERWYKNETNKGEFKKMKADHPVAYAENDATVGRNQAISKSGHTVGTIEIGKTSGKAYQSDDAIGTKGELKATGGDVKSKGQLGEGEAAIEVGSAKGGTEINKKHISANAEAQLIDAQAQGELGSKDNNLHGKGEAKALSANASGLLGVDGMEAKAEAVGANAGIEGGFTLSGINFDAGASVGAQAGGGVEIDARGIEVDAKFVFGGKIKITW